MGRQAFPIIGGIIGAAVVGFYTVGTGTLQGYAAGFALGSAVGGIAGSYIDPIVLQGNKVGDNQIQVAAEGGARAIMFGQCCVTATCVIARGNRKVMKNKTSNGKGSSGSTVNQTVTWTFAIGLGEAIPGGSITRIWQDETLVYDIINGGVSSDDNAKFVAKFRFYDGNEMQLPDPDLQVFLADDTPYFRGTSYVVFPNFDLTQTAERIPTFRFEVISQTVGVEDLNALGFSFPSIEVSTPQITPITLHGSPDAVYSIDLFLTGSMECRYYATKTGVVGADGRFITATDSSASTSMGANVYVISVDNPAQTYYLNNHIVGDTDATDFRPIDEKLSIQVAGNGTVTFGAYPVDSASGFSDQFCTVTAAFKGFVGIGSAPIELSAIASLLMLRAGMTEDQFDVSALTDQVAGVCIQETINGNDALNSCVQPFFADPCEVDAVLKYVKRGAAVVRTLTIDDLTEEPDASQRQNVIEYPAKLSFFYQSPLTGYATTKETSSRYSPQADSSSEASVTAPITFSDSNVPANIASMLHKVMWTEAGGSFTWAVGMTCIDLVPTDTLGLYLRGILTRVRIINIDNDGESLTLTMVKDRQSSYTANVTTIPLPLPTPPLPTTMSKAVLAVLDIPALQDTDDQLCYYTAMSGSTATWSGGQLQRSLDGGATWTPIGEVTSDVTMGRLTVAMTAADSGYTDTTNTITVQLFDPANDLVSYSDTTFLQEQGAVAVQIADGTWELMQYRDAVDGGAGLWTLSYLQRGRLSTSAGPHATGSLFVFLDNDVVKNAAQTAWLGGVVKHRAVSYGESAEDADVVTVTYEGRSQQEWQPASASAEYDGEFVYVHDIVARDRFGTEVNPISSINFQGFQVTLTDGTSSITSQVLGTSAHITASPLTSVSSVSIAGLNKLTGAGPALNIAPASVPAGSLIPEAVFNGGGGS